MFRIAPVIFTLLASVLVILATPVPVTNGQLNKRVTHVGSGTWFYVGWPGKLWQVNVDSDPIVAISKSLYDQMGEWIEITNTENGKVAYGLTRDSCPGCGWNDLAVDLSPSLFEQLGTLETGRLKISWHFMNKEWSP
ncbi:hypothetical protein BD779DRAFT_1434041 [Infundibulicybe gibba]|nr:hypothetical protein BD779DRAFT_1434041 [Infundibulicybe gibba]